MKCKICGSKTKIWIRDLFDDRHGYPDKFDIYKCIKCGFAQTSPQLLEREIPKIYSKYYPWAKISISKVKLNDYNRPSRFKIWRKGLEINGQYLPNIKGRVLDVGCGMGFSLLELKNIGCIPYGVDVDKNASKISKKFGLNFHKGTLSDNPFPKVKFDYIIANQVIEHVTDPIDFINKCKKRLTDNGKIFLSFPNTNSASRIILGKKWLHWHIPYHLNFFNHKSINTLAKKTKVKIKTIKTVTPNMWTNLQIRRLTQKPIIGKRDTFWDGKIQKGNLLNTGYIQKIIYYLEEYNLINRFIDATGYGESFSVIVEKD